MWYESTDFFDKFKSIGNVRPCGRSVTIDIEIFGDGVYPISISPEDARRLALDLQRAILDVIEEG